jgi:hypothetical protein
MARATSGEPQVPFVTPVTAIPCCPHSRTMARAFSSTLARSTDTQGRPT